MAVLSRQRDPLVAANQIVEEIPAGVAYVLERALDLNAAQRPASAALMRSMLREHEKYESQAPTVVDHVVPGSASIHAQDTRLMPGSTIGDPGRQTDIKTEVMMGAPLSQVTSVRSEAGERKSRRGSVLGALAVVAIVIAGPIIGASYLYYPQLFGHEQPPIEQQAAVPVPEDVKSIAVDANASANSTAVDLPSDVTANSVNASPGGAAPKTTNQSTTARAPANPTAPPRDPNKIVVDGETIYMGDTKITDDKIETPDTIIDDNGVTPKVPLQPRVRNPRMIPPPDLSHLTPEQRRRVMRALRRNGVIIVRPTPPSN